MFGEDFVVIVENFLFFYVFHMFKKQAMINKITVNDWKDILLYLTLNITN